MTSSVSRSPVHVALRNLGVHSAHFAHSVRSRCYPVATGDAQNAATRQAGFGKRLA